LDCFQHVNRFVYGKESLFPVNKQLTAGSCSALSPEAGMPLRYPRFPSSEPWFYPPASGPTNPDPAVLTDGAGRCPLDIWTADLGELLMTRRARTTPSPTTVPGARGRLVVPGRTLPRDLRQRGRLNRSAEGSGGTPDNPRPTDFADRVGRL
jgi:hypothetical protein